MIDAVRSSHAALDSAGMIINRYSTTYYYYYYDYYYCYYYYYYYYC